MSAFGLSISDRDILCHILDWSLIPCGLMDLICWRAYSYFIMIKIDSNPTCWQVDAVLFSAVLCAGSHVSDNIYGLYFPIAAVLRYFTAWAVLKLRNIVLGLGILFVLCFGWRCGNLCVFKLSLHYSKATNWSLVTWTCLGLNVLMSLQKLELVLWGKADTWCLFTLSVQVGRIQLGLYRIY